MQIQYVIFALSDQNLNVLLKRQENHSFKEEWILPTCEVTKPEHFETCVQRNFAELAGVENTFLEQLHAFVYPENENNQLLVHIVYYAMLNRNKFLIRLSSGTPVKECFPVSALPHVTPITEQYIQLGLKRLRERVKYQPIGFYQLSTEFEMSELKRVYEMILGKTLDSEVFTSKLLQTDLVFPVNQAGIYRFNTQKYFDLKQTGFYFDV